jgi:flagellar export protein FliJ
MKPFRFTLEAVSTLRQRQEQKAMDQYVRSLALRSQAAERLETAESTLTAAWQEWRTQMTQGVTAIEAARAQAHHRLLMRQRDECVTGLETADRRVNAALQAMIAAKQQREVVDKCFEKQKARHTREQLQEEQKFMDDLAGRKNGSLFAWKPVENSL